MNEEEIKKYNERCAKLLKLKRGMYQEYLLPYRDNWYGDNDYNEWACSDSYIDDSVHKGYVENCWVIPLSNLKFHSDWNWIMEVYEKINNSKITAPINGIPDSIMPYLNARRPIVKGLIDNKKEVVVEAINQFLIWYETQK